MPSAPQPVTLQSAPPPREVRTPGLRGPLPVAGLTPGPGPAVAAALVTLALLVPVQALVTPPLLLAERFVPGAGWAQVALLAGWAAWLARAVGKPGGWARWRPRAWALFSFVFFAQLLLGLLGVERCLMTGKLHLPVPALVIAGPIWRGEGFFMLGLLFVTVVLVGPAWCSWLCYIGAWDQLLAGRRRLRRPLSPRARERVRLGLLIAVVLVAWLLRRLGAEPLLATLLAAGLGLIGVGVMAAVSARRGWLAHCTSYCPLGWLVVRLGKISPFRLRIASGCGSCGQCRPLCRYGALDREAWRRLKPHASCTLCGDCVAGCGALEVTFPGLSTGRARQVLLVLVVSLHAVFLGLARI
jgi:hypothetical protein